MIRSGQRKSLSRQQTWCNCEKLCRDTKCLYYNTKQRSKKKLSLDKEFAVVTYYSSIQAATCSRIVATQEKLCRDINQTTSEELCRDIANLCLENF